MNNEQASLFFQRYRRPVLSLLIMITAAVLGVVAFLTIRDVSNKKALGGMEELAAVYTELKSSFNDEDEAKAAEVQALRENLADFGRKTGAYSGARAWSMAGDISAAKKAWQDAEDAYVSAAQKGAKTFLAPVSLYNAAVCAEEQGKNEEARAYWAKSLAYKDFPLAARAQFSIARVWEKTGGLEEALAAYRLVIESYEKETDWVYLAQSRIIALEAAPAQ